MFLLVSAWSRARPVRPNEFPQVATAPQQRPGRPTDGALRARTERPGTVPVVPDDLTPDQQRKADLAAKYQFDRCCTTAFDLVIPAWERHEAGDDPDADLDVPSVDEVAEALDHGPVAVALVDYVLGAADTGSPELDSFASGLIESTRTAHIGALFVRAMNAEAEGRVLEAEADYTAALDVDPGYTPAIYELARFASDRGDIPRAVALYRRVGSGAQPEVDFLDSLLPDHSKVGRNDPCPCGSGRKFKQCHLANPEVPADRAALWLFQKVLGYGYREQFEPIRSGLARAAAEGAGHPEAAAEITNEPFLLDLSVFDTGIIGRFAAERAVLLPPGELEMLHDWMAIDRRLWELTEVEVGARIVLRDVLSGETVEVPERVASTSLRVDDLLLTRVVHVHGELQLIGQPMPIVPRRRQAVTEMVDGDADAETWARWFGTLIAPADRRNGEGEAIIVGAAIVRPGSGVEAPDLLSGLYEPSDEVEGRWTDVTDLEGEHLTRATLDLEHDGRIVVRADSDERLDRVLDALRSADPDLVVEGDERKPFASSKVSDLVGDPPTTS
jgi:hypothetical protein